MHLLKKLSSLIIVLMFIALLSACMKSYTVTFVTNGGNEISSIETNGKSAITLPKDPVKEVYTFAGWYLDDGVFKEPLNFMDVENNYTAYAKWDINKYTYTFYDEDKITILKKETVDYGSAILPPTNPNKPSDGQYSYTFAGWDQPIPATITKDITFKARYNKVNNQYTYTFYDEDGTTILKSLTVDYGTVITAPIDPIKQNTNQYTYTFKGWDKAIPANITENIIIKAEYTKKLLINTLIHFLMKMVQLS